MEVLTLLNNCYKVIREVQAIRSALKFHKEKGKELADRLALLEEHLRIVGQDLGGDAHQVSTAAKALCNLQGHLVKAYEVLLKCRKGKILRIISYSSIRDEIVDVNLSISTCLGDFAFFNALPQNTQIEWQQLLQRLNNMAPLKKEEVEVDAIPETVLSEISDASDVRDRSRALRELHARGLLSDADLAAFLDEVVVQTERDRESVNALLRDMGEEVRVAQLGKAAQEQNDLQEICRLIQMLEREDGSSSGTGDGSFRGDPPPEYLCPITGQLMVDPVVLIETGQTYERAAIERWLARHATCPRTNQVVRSTLCAPVVQLRSVIRDWAERNGVQLEQPVSQTNPLTLPLANLGIGPGASGQSNSAAIAVGGTGFSRNEPIAAPPPTNPVAQYNAGMAHFQAVPQELARAMACFHVAIRQKPTFAEALYMLGTCHKLQNDRNGALNFFRAAAGQNFPQAQHQLGVMLSGNEGLGFLQAAAQAGVPDAQCALGEFYQQKKKYDVARGYWAAAAGRGHAQAQYLLGLSFLEGKGTKKDINQAFHWLQKASAGGHTGASKKLKIFK